MRSLEEKFFFGRGGSLEEQFGGKGVGVGL